jgi:hypothetical protein
VKCEEKSINTLFYFVCSARDNKLSLLLTMPTAVIPDKAVLVFVRALRQQGRTWARHTCGEQQLPSFLSSQTV